MHPTANSVVFMRRTPSLIALKARRVMPGVRHWFFPEGVPDDEYLDAQILMFTCGVFALALLTACPNVFARQVN